VNAVDQVGRGQRRYGDKDSVDAKCLSLVDQVWKLRIDRVPDGVGIGQEAAAERCVRYRGIDGRKRREQDGHVRRHGVDPLHDREQLVWYGGRGIGLTQCVIRPEHEKHGVGPLVRGYFRSKAGNLSRSDT
jgi:hypothetical protein